MEKILDAKLKERNKKNSEKKKAATFGETILTQFQL